MSDQSIQPMGRPDWSARAGFIIAELFIVALAAFAGAGVYRYVTRSDVVNTSLGCVNTVVTTSQQPTGPAMAEGGDIEFRDDIAPGHGIANQQILGVYVPPGSYAVTAVGDSVRVCLLGIPQKVTPAGESGCDPAVDIRGRSFLVYDKANGNAQVYSNGEHGCGGA